MSKKEPVAVTSTRITVVGTIIVAVIGLISTLVLGYWQFGPKPNGTDQVTETEYRGRVIDVNTQQTIAGAKITLDLEGVPPIIYTDSEGVYRFKVVINSDISGQIRVDAQGYQIYTRNITLSSSTKNIGDMRLIPITSHPTPTSTLPQADDLATPEIPTQALSNAILVMNNYYSWINNAGNKDDLRRSWNLQTSGVNGLQCREQAGCVFSNFQNWWWQWKVQYKLYDCGSNIVDAEVRYYERDPLLASTSIAPTYIRYQLIDDHSQLKINTGDIIEGPGADCRLEISIQ